MEMLCTAEFPFASVSCEKLQSIFNEYEDLIVADVWKPIMHGIELIDSCWKNNQDSKDSEKL